MLCGSSLWCCKNFFYFLQNNMSSPEASVTVAIGKARSIRRDLDSPESTESGNSNGFTTDSETSSSIDLRIPIVGYEVMEERARFTVYKLRVEFKNGDCWFIFRRYTDFSRLYGQLKRQKAPISHLILPRKKWLGDNFAPNFLEERIRGLQAFVNGLLNSPDLVTLSCVREFFCLDEPPTLSDTVEESRAILEALEDTIYNLKQQLKEREANLTAETNLCNELKKKLHNILNESHTCSNCGAINDFSAIS